MWHTKPVDSVLKELDVDYAKGLTEADASQRLIKYGVNKIHGKHVKSVFRVFFAHLIDWLIIILIVAAIITLFMGEYIDAAIIIAVIFINATLGTIQEIRATKAIEALQKLTFPLAIVRRDGNIVKVDATQLVIGDIILLEAGSHIPADLRLIETALLQIDESALTGESVPSKKDVKIEISDENIPLGDRSNCAYMSTMVTNGTGVGVVVATAMDAEIGKIAKLINDEKRTLTPLEARLQKLGKTLGLIAIGICLAIFFIGLIQGRNITEMFLTAVSLAVAAIPEGLAAIVAVVLSIGVTGMAKQQAIVKKLSAVETLGSVNIICTDKTGTLTQNKMTVLQYFTWDKQVIIDDENTKQVGEDVTLLSNALLLCSDATMNNDEAIGDPTEIALLVFSDRLGFNRTTIVNEHKRISEFPFDATRKLMSTLHEFNSEFHVYTKGAIVSLLAICKEILINGKVVPISNTHINHIREIAETMSNEALRTLGVAYKKVTGKVEHAEMEKDLVFIGMVGMLDPPRKEVKSVIERAFKAGITTIMITGDHKHTAFAIAKELSIADSMDQVYTGMEIDDQDVDHLLEHAAKYRVFARVSPEHKVNIVKSLKAAGNVVAMTGDGVNDAPSLNAADIGIAMGKGGTDIARGAADMILVDDNYVTIINAVERGRNIYNSIKKSILFLLTCNLGEVIAVFITIVAGCSAPLIATQLLWINLITDSLPALALGLDKGSPDVMERKPRSISESFFSGNAGWRVIVGGIIIGSVTIAAFWFGYFVHGYSVFNTDVPDVVLSYARSLAFMVLVIAQLFYALTLRSSTQSVFNKQFFKNKLLIISLAVGILLQILIFNIAFLRDAFHLQMPDVNGWIAISILGIFPLAVSEVLKVFLRFSISGKPKQ